MIRQVLKIKTGLSRVRAKMQREEGREETDMQEEKMDTSVVNPANLAGTLTEVAKGKEFKERGLSEVCTNNILG